METKRFEIGPGKAVIMAVAVAVLALAAPRCADADEVEDPYDGPEFAELDSDEIVDEHGPLLGNDAERERQRTNVMRVLQILADQVAYFMSTEDMKFETYGKIKNVGKIDVVIAPNETLVLYFRKQGDKYYFAFSSEVLNGDDFSPANSDVYSQDVAREDVVHASDQNDD